MSASRRRWALALAALAGLALAGAGVRATLAAFSATTASSGNSFSAAASFGGQLGMASGSYTGDNVDGRAISVGFQPDLVIVKADTAQGAVARTSTMSGDASKPLTGATALTANVIQALTVTGFSVGTDTRVNQSGTTYRWVAFKAGAGALRVGSYTGNGATTQSIGGLDFSPEAVFVMGGGATRAMQRQAGMTRSFRFDAGTGLTNVVNSLNPNGFTVGNAVEANTNGATYHYVAFNDSAGSIKSGSYAGTGASRSVSGVGFQPRYVMVRANDNLTAREGNHRPASLPGASSMFYGATANTSTGITALQPDGFQLGTNGSVNASGVTYHYMALYNSAGCTSPGSQTVQASADSWVDQASPATNKGTDTVLKLTSRDPSLNARAVVQFNLPALPSGCTVTSATLRLNNKSPLSGRTIEALRNTASWTETGVTWTNQPATAGAAATATTPSAAGWMQWDVTSHVQAMYAGSNNGFVLRDQTENGAGFENQFDSREASANRPELVVVVG